MTTGVISVPVFHILAISNINCNIKLKFQTLTLTLNCHFYIIAIIENFINKFWNNVTFTIILWSRMLKNDIHSHCYYYYYYYYIVLIAWNQTNVFFSSNTSYSCWEWNIQLGQKRPTYTQRVSTLFLPIRISFFPRGHSKEFSDLIASLRGPDFPISAHVHGNAFVSFCPFVLVVRTLKEFDDIVMANLLAAIVRGELIINRSFI